MDAICIHWKQKILENTFMATIQAKTSRGRKYWYIVESRRINGKPRPVVLEYLGKPLDLLRRLRGLTDKLVVKSYSHGGVCALLDVARKLDVVTSINKYVKAQRSYMADKPLRHNLTAGITLLLGAIGRVCMPTSKRGWWNWARTTSCEYLLRVSLSKIDSQHFWDIMDCIPITAIERIELEVTRKILRLYKIETDNMMYDTTNLYTYINSTNSKCSVAQRGKNKQKRNDLRQVGLAMVVTRRDFIPLFHLTYRGNMNDTVVFGKVLRKIKKRLVDLSLDIEKHTLVFDRGCNSKKNLARVKRLKLHYVCALTPAHHLELVEDAESGFREECVENKTLFVYRDKRVIWEEERTIVVYISEKLKEGQLRGIYQSLEKKKKELRKIQRRLSNPRSRIRNERNIRKTIETLLKGQYMEGLISYTLQKDEEGRFHMTWRTNLEKLKTLEDRLGFRILMTDRHEWSTEEIINAYHGQSAVELAFKNIKSPHHLAIQPEFHWTDQKIHVHQFMCVLGYQLSALLWREARLKAGFKGSLDRMLDILNNIRLAMLLEKTKTRGRIKASYNLEEMDDEEKKLMDALKLTDFHTKRPKIKGVGVYTQ